MPNYNRLILAGHLTRDPEGKHTPSGTFVSEFGIAVNDHRDKTMFIDCTAFNKTAELVTGHLVKGRAVLLEGKLQLDQWTNQEGQKRSKHCMVVDRVTFIDSRGQQQDGNQSHPRDYGQQSPSYVPDSETPF